MTATTHSISKQSHQTALVSGDKPAIRFIKRQAVEGITGLSCTEIYRRIGADNFPKQVMLGPKCVVWVEAEIYGWMNERIAESRQVA
ncbi:AlpA family phage regulatory protein [Pseudomonas sp. CCI4.2]|uniref:helix-turn-helix transcriptional regulator n=1 Tax=Pseudomonas sp. CCI4.2 TaxID=3048620 RepID=UPI002AC8ED56|nr:AlpA family phage regulatory protein [Pseudomonas sp. CCI4.2]MEB0091801.1 AlpA family phage regulatory protein [Pseudomonas sp. CCI4.2]WPX54848.1 AlpA family phage regulatory protein [Pseudomonas sp. CCI4.2]